MSTGAVFAALGGVAALAVSALALGARAPAEAGDAQPAELAGLAVDEPPLSDLLDAAARALARVPQAAPRAALAALAALAAELGRAGAKKKLQHEARAGLRHVALAAALEAAPADDESRPQASGRLFVTYAHVKRAFHALGRHRAGGRLREALAAVGKRMEAVYTPDVAALARKMLETDPAWREALPELDGLVQRAAGAAPR